MTDATARAELCSRLSEVIGVDNVGTLMSYLPGDEPATKSDLSVLDVGWIGSSRGWIDSRTHFKPWQTRIDQRMDSFRAALLYQGRTFAMACVGSIVLTAALVAGIVRAL